MKFLLAFLLCVALAFAHDWNSEAVIKGTESNFQEVVKASDLSLVAMYAPWCGHCKSLAPNFGSAAEQLKGVAQLVAVDCTVEKDLCGKYGVRGYPTLKVFSNDGSAPVDYAGGRGSNDIVNFMKRQKLPAYRVVASEEELASIISSEPLVVIGNFESAESKAASAFVSVAKKLRNDYTFAIVTGSGSTGVSVARGSSRVSMEGDSSAESAITKFISIEAFPLVGEIGPDNYQKYVDRGFPLVWLFLNPQNTEQSASITGFAEKIAPEFKGKLSIVTLDGNRWSQHAQSFGLSGTPPGIVIEDRSTGKNYVLSQSEEVTEASLHNHLASFIDGSLQPTLKSEPVPETQEGPVYVIVGETFEQIVNDPERDVFVEIYAPWCGHCKSLAPKWEKMAEDFKSNSKVRIAKIDGTANDVPVEVKGFPTLYLFPANNKANPIPYNGDRTEEAMTAWLRQHGSTFGSSHDEL